MMAAIVGGRSVGPREAACASAVSWLLASCCASAQTPSVDSLPPVTVAVDRYDARRDDTATKIIVTRDELVRFGDTTLAESIKRLPGVTVSSNGAITLRGLGNGYTQILLNGERPPAGFTLESLDPGSIERIEILRSATADLSTEAIAGTINIILRAATKTDAQQVTVGLATSRGKLTPTLGWRISDQGATHSYGLSVAASHRNFLVNEQAIEIGTDAAGQQNSLRTSSLQANGQQDQLSLTPSAKLKLAGNDTLSFQGFALAMRSRKYGDLRSQTLQGEPEQYARRDQRTDTSSTLLRGDVNWVHELEAGRRLDVKAGVNLAARNVEFGEQGFSTDGSITLDDVTRSHVRERGLSTAGKYSTPFMGDHTLALGWDWGISRRREDRVQYQRDLPGAVAVNSDQNFDAQVDRLAVYAQDEWAVTPHWSMYLGLRWEQISLRSQGNEFAAVRSIERLLSPLAQTVWKLPGTDNGQLRLGVSRTFRAPPIQALIPRPYTSTNNTPLNPDTQGNPALKPERAVGVDLSYERFAKSGAMFSVGGYARQIDGIIRTEVTQVGDRWVSSPLNGGPAHVWGIEMDTRFDVSKLADGAPPLEMRFNLTSGWSRVDAVPGPDNRVDKQVRLSSTLAADYRVNSQLKVGSSFTFKQVGRVRTSLREANYTGPRREIDVYGLLTASRWVSLRLSLSNLLRQDEVTGSRYVDEEGSLSAYSRRVSPMTVRAALEVRY